MIRALSFATLLLLLAACGGEEDQAPLRDPEASSNILEGTIDDSMIDLAGGDTVMVLEDGSAEGTDQPKPEPKEDAEAPEEPPAPPADESDEPEPDVAE